MSFLRRRRAAGPAGDGHEALSISGVRFLDGPPPGAGDAETAVALRRIVDEAVLLQGLTEDILEGVRQRRSLSELAPPGGALISRFCVLRAGVPDTDDPGLRECARTLRETLDHHATTLSYSLDLLGDLRPERVSDQLDRIDGLGTPARRLIRLQDQLARDAP
jgi:hypothetical protein